MSSMGNGNGHATAFEDDRDYSDAADVRAAIFELRRADADHERIDDARYAELTTAIRSLLGGVEAIKDQGEIIKDQGDLILAYHQATLTRVAALDHYLPLEAADAKKLVAAADKALEAVKLAREAKAESAAYGARIDAIEERNRGIDTESIRSRASLTSEVEHLKEEQAEIKEELETTAQRNLDALIAKAKEAQLAVDAANQAKVDAIKRLQEGQHEIVLEKRKTWTQTYGAFLSVVVLVAGIIATAVATQCGATHSAPIAPAHQEHP